MLVDSSGVAYQGKCRAVRLVPQALSTPTAFIHDCHNCLHSRSRCHIRHLRCTMGDERIRDKFSCYVCEEYFATEVAAGVDRRPMIACENGHTYCAACLADWREKDASCPECRVGLCAKPILNRILIDTIDQLLKQSTSVVPAPGQVQGHVTLEPEPFARGSCAHLYRAKWLSQTVAVKRLLASMQGEERMRQCFHLELSLAMRLNHPNIVRVYGSIDCGHNETGIVMELASRGSLDKFLWAPEQPLSFDQKVKSSIRTWGATVLHMNDSCREFGTFAD